MERLNTGELLGEIKGNAYKCVSIKLRKNGVVHVPEYGRKISESNLFCSLLSFLSLF